jgi:hypothetical protein
MGWRLGLILNRCRFMPQTAKRVQLTSETLEAFEVYIRETEAAMEQTLRGATPFLWSDASSERAQQVRQGRILAQYWSGQRPIRVANGLIHDWIGASFIPNTTVKRTVGLIQNYNNHKNIYKPEVIDSKLLSHRGNDFKIYLRLLKQKIITVVLDTYHDVHYSSLDHTRWLCRSRTTRILEVEGAGSSNERIMPPDAGYGFLWRLNSYWRFQEKEGGVFAECRAISLSRNVPFGLGWLIEPIIQILPRETLINTLNATHQALAGASPARHPSHPVVG